MHHHFKLLLIYCDFTVMIHTQFGTIIEAFQSDYLLHEFCRLLVNHGTLPQLSFPYAHISRIELQNNHRHIIDTGRVLIFSCSVPRRLWAMLF